MEAIREAPLLFIPLRLRREQLGLPALLINSSLLLVTLKGSMDYLMAAESGTL